MISQRHNPSPGDGQRGGVLITVLLLVSVLAVLGVAVMEDIRYGIQLAANRRDGAQAQAYALGAEQLAITLLGKASLARPDRTTLEDAWARGPMVFPLDRGMMRVEVRDASNCFNVNSLVAGRIGEDLDVSPKAAERYKRLLAALDLPEDVQTSLTNALIDWLDTNTVAEPQGAEDYHYMGLEVPYRAGNGPIADVSELRAVRGYTAQLYRFLAPYLCAHRSLDPGEINVNTLAPERAALLSMLVGSDLPVENASDLLLRRPPGGYRSLELFWSQEAFAEIAVPEDEKALVSLKTLYFDLSILAAVDDAEADMRTLLREQSPGYFVVEARRYGDLE